ncbi:MAG: ABC transporter ATP-binding protein [Vicinamibacteria bacterium]|nr:ABC transporter ATP-binding protein [Vicinamibacteria bacterium]
MSDNLLVLSEVKKTLRTPFSRKPGFPVGPLNLTIGPAEIVGLIGANGAGKTTTIKLILGLLVPEAGRVELAGTPSASNAWRSQVGYLPEQPAFYEYLSGLEFMRFAGELFDLRGEALSLKVNHLLDRVGLSDSRHRAIRTYSKGMLQRLGIAQALLNNPRLLIMDEPMSGLDPLGRRFVRDLLLELRAEGRSILFSTHIIPDAEYVCDRVALMRGGQLVAVGTFDELLGLPTEFEVASVSAAEAGPAQRASVTVKPAELTTTIGDIVSRGGQLVSVSPVRTAVEDLLAPGTREGN